MALDPQVIETLREHYNPEGSDLRLAQHRMVKMLKYFDEICTNNNLSYWIDSGTLLGAVRHQGFIPWDDDIDICMMRKDVIKLKKLLKKRTGSVEGRQDQYVLQCHETDSAYFSMWDKIRDVYSANISHSYVQDRLLYKGLALDIFPIDEGNYDWLRRITSRIVDLLINWPLCENNGVWNRLRPIVGPSYHFIRYIILPFAHLLSYRHHNSVLSLSYGMPFQWAKRGCFKNVFPLKRIEFEGTLFYAPNQYESYLENLYGPNWNELPPEESRVSHDINIVFFDE